MGIVFIILYDSNSGGSFGEALSPFGIIGLLKVLLYLAITAGLIFGFITLVENFGVVINFIKTYWIIISVIIVALIAVLIIIFISKILYKRYRIKSENKSPHYHVNINASNKTNLKQNSNASLKQRENLLIPLSKSLPVEIVKIQMYSTGARGKVYTNTFYKAVSHNFGVDIRLKNNNSSQKNVNISWFIYDSNGKKQGSLSRNKISINGFGYKNENFYIQESVFSRLRPGKYRYEFQINDRRTKQGFFTINGITKTTKFDKIFEEYEKKLNNIFEENSAPTDIITHMLKDTKETTEHFKISKSDAKKSFHISIIFATLGFILILFAVVWGIVSQNITPTIISSIGGVVTDVIAGTAFFIRKQSLTQLNHYFDKLSRNQDILVSVKMVEKMSKDKRDDMYQEIIKNVLNNTLIKN